MSWYIVYRGKTDTRGSLTEILDKAGITYYIPKRTAEHYADNQMKIKEEDVLRNLIFINTEEDIHQLARQTDGLRNPYIDRASGKVATITDDEMQRFMRFMKLSNASIRILPDPYQRFKVCQKVRVKAGEFEGTIGYVFRIRGDRKLVISLGNMALAISGIHYTLLESIEE